RTVENHLRDALKIDRARIQTSRISRFGLLEMSRQRMRPSLGDSTQLPCPRCKGQGTIRNVESVALSVLRILEEEAMKKGTEKVIAHLPIECATFLLNEKRHAIEQIEARLKVGIIILPSKHLETPAYDIERIKEKDSIEEKPSYLQIKAEDIAIPEFAQQIKPKIEKAAVKEFMHETPAPVQTKNEAASLIKRFWHKLVGPSIEPEVKVPPSSTVVEKARSADESQSSRGRSNRRGRSQGQKNQEPRPNRAPQEQDIKQEQNKEPRTNRNIRGPGRNVRRNLAPVNNAVDESVELIKSDSVIANEIPITEATMLTPEVSASIEEETKQTARKNTSRRGPNRRRPRNPNYKKTDVGGDSNGGDAGATTGITGEARTRQSRSYDSDFAERVEKTERSEPQASVAPEPQASFTESVPKVVEE
ncbi:MAG: ribonuclease E/G, partial [Methylococcaceae bacterium]|nr:ribonuclease E/G [Methylococcaceae bacterium]